ncbi:MAG: hypothetical protein R2831_05555 [Chitinophagaceae bacterium]
MLLSIFTESCRPIRSCSLISGVNGFYQNLLVADSISAYDSVSYQHVQGNVVLESVFYTCKNTSPFITSCIAYKPAYQYYAHDTIKNIFLYSKHNWDTNHLVGDSLNGVFDIENIANFYDGYVPNANQFVFRPKQAPALSTLQEVYAVISYNERMNDTIFYNPIYILP